MMSFPDYYDKSNAASHNKSNLLNTLEKNAIIL